MTAVIKEIRQLKNLSKEGDRIGHDLSPWYNFATDNWESAWHPGPSDSSDVPSSLLRQGDPLDAQLDIETISAEHWRNKFVSDIWKSDWHLSQGDANNLSLPSTLRNELERSIIGSLSFPAMRDRGDLIPEAYKKTFEWIFHDSTGFTKWLEAEDEPIYWITGKPGSGKSTLIKYILDHPTITSSLRSWAGRMKAEPLCAGYYFWEAGSTPLQKSRVGLMRTLLYQCLSKRPDLLPVVCPRRYSLYAALGNPSFTPPSWTLEELSEAITLLSARSGQDFRLAFFIDGLDEFDGKPEDIISFIHSIRFKHNVKLCVSSRPWMAFADALAQSPSLAMQDLTQQDILTFVQGRFHSMRAFKEREAASPEASAKLIKDITLRANGVFLWVSIVVRLLLGDMENGQNLDILQHTLECLPQDISALYTKIWQSIDPTKIQTFSRFFQIKMAAFGIIRLDAQLMWLADGEALPEGDDNAVLEIIQPILVRKLVSFTRGMLEVSPSGSVELIHRTASDWVKRSEVWEEICSGTKMTPSFDPSLALLRAANIYFVPKIAHKASRSKAMRMHLVESLDRKPRFNLIQSLTLAGNVADRPETASQLTKALDEFNSILSGADDSTVYSRTHWSTTAVWPSGQTSHGKITFASVADNCFVNLAASFAIVPFVREKMARHPGLLSSKRHGDRLSLLESAIRGGSHDDNWYSTNCPPEYERRSWFRPDARIKMIRSILDAGGSPESRAYLSGPPDKTIRQWVENYFAVSKTYAENDGWSLLHGNEGYWTEVSALIASHEVTAQKRLLLWWKKVYPTIARQGS